MNIVIGSGPAGVAAAAALIDKGLPVTMLDAAPRYTFGDGLTGPEEHETQDYRGTHGQLPSRAELRSALIVYGEAAKVGARMPLARMIDIAPTAAGLLGLRFPVVEGSPIRELIKETFVLPTEKKKKAEK